MLTSSRPRPRHHVGRTVAIVVVGALIVAALLGAGYAVTRGSSTATPTPSSAPSTTTSPAAPSTAPTDSAVPFVALPVGTPPSLGVSESTYPWHKLTATLHGPKTVTAGSTVDYRVVVKNPTGVNVTLSPCPSYDLTVGFQTTSYGLNCAGTATVIGPGQSVSFDLPVGIPRNVNSGGTTDITWALGWQPDKNSPHSKVTVTVK